MANSSSSSDFKFGSIETDILLPSETYTGAIAIEVKGMCWATFVGTDLSKIDEVIGNLKLSLVRVDAEGEQQENINLSGISARILDFGENTTSIEISFDYQGSAMLVGIGNYYIRLSTSIGESHFEVLSSNTIEVKSKLDIVPNVNIIRNDYNLEISIELTSRLNLSEYENTPKVQVQFYTEDLKYSTPYLIDGANLNFISEDMTSERYFHESTDNILTRIGTLNNIVAHITVSLNALDKLTFKIAVPVNVIFDTYDDGEKKGFAIGKFCNEEKDMFECELPAQFNSSISGVGVIDYIYPIGSFFDTDNETFNPNIHWGGTRWELMNDGRFLLSSSPDYFITEDGVANLGGEETHKLTTSEMPAHDHGVGYRTIGAAGNARFSMVGQANANREGNVSTSSIGGSKAHNNMPPYRVVHRWHRVG